ncbi:B12 binding domain protein [Candidatus Bilamarchaeum dharawalense]|uniref:B12 binding domain protein n=1 Tax=Candidatus Bilamarchaeum dharawalense TaxID=2885759 RepID=A0A5E4LRD3_9ARCH|nr:B12 binding domain protein [Candidatus Bilamarchaeum dharawalense]
MVTNKLICPRNTQNIAQLVVTTRPTRSYSVITDQLRAMGSIDSIDLYPGKSLKGRVPSSIKIALIRPLGSLAGEEEKEAVKEMGEPYQLELLASVLRSQGYPVRIFDQLASPYDPANPLNYPKTKSNTDFVAEISAFNPDVAGFSTFTYNFRKGLTLAGELKQKLGLPIIFGGYHPTSVGKQYLLFDRFSPQNPEAADVFKQDLRNIFQHGIVDYACIGEGIRVLPELLLVLRELEDPRAVSGISFMANGQLQISAADRVPLDNYPLPFRADDFDLMRHYATGRGYPFLLLMTSNGCRFSCEYCSTGSMNYPGLGYRSIPRVIDELRQIKEKFHGVWPNQKIMINIIDEDFASNPSRVIALCNAIEAAGLNKFFEFNSFLDNQRILGPFGHEILDAMHRAGFVFCFIGIESMLDSALDGYNRPDRFENRLQSVQAAIDRMAEHQLLYFGDHITGYPLHTPADLREDYQRLLQLRRMHYTYFPILAPMPGTPLYWRVLFGMLGDGFLPGVTYDHLDANHQVLALQGRGDVKPIRDFFVQRFFSRPEYELDADQAISRNPFLAQFFARMLPKVSADYPNNEVIQKLSKKFQS